MLERGTQKLCDKRLLMNPGEAKKTQIMKLFFSCRANLFIPNFRFTSVSLLTGQYDPGHGQRPEQSVQPLIEGVWQRRVGWSLPEDVGQSNQSSHERQAAEPTEHCLPLEEQQETG